VLAFNRALTYATQSALDLLIQRHQVNVFTYHDLAVTLLSGAGRLPSSEGTADYFNRLLPEGLADLLASPQGATLPCWDALVVDEAQDLDPTWLQPLTCLLRHPDRDPILLLEDPAQSLFRQAHHNLGQPWRLDMNLRQHPALRRASCLIHPACGWEAPEVHQADDVFRQVQSGPRSWREDLARELSALAAMGLAPNQVMVLAPHRPQTLKVEDGTTFGPWQVNTVSDWWEGAKAQHVRFGTVQGFKGLESDVVLYLAPGYRRSDAPLLAYTAYSRARHRLIVLDKALGEPERPQPVLVSPPAPWPTSVPKPPLPQVRTLPADQQACLLSALTVARQWPQKPSAPLKH